MTTGIILACALMLDAILGEPDWAWRRLRHPAVLMGDLIGWCERHLNRGSNRRLRGIMTLIFIVLIAGGIGLMLSTLGPVVEVIVAAILLAQRSLIDHVRAVADGLRVSLLQGRRAVAMIVSRDTAQMDGSDVVRASIESASENLSDGVIAPAFWFLIAGLPGILIYKMVNTADSMIGYRTDRYADFGWASAKLDDLMNLIPARLTALFIMLSAQDWGGWPAIRKDAAFHKSPNAGWPEAAMARAIGAALAGPRSYDGVIQPFPWVNERGQKTLGSIDIDATLHHMWRAWGVMVLLALALGIAMG